MLVLDESARGQLSKISAFFKTIQKDSPGETQKLRKNLACKLEYLNTYACRGDGQEIDRKRTRCRLFEDFAPLSFVFVMEIRQDDGKYERWFNGGLIFHGPHDGGGDGGAPTFSVNLSPSTGWSVHT